MKIQFQDPKEYPKFLKENIVTSEAARPYAKRAPRKSNTTRKKTTSTVLNDTHVIEGKEEKKNEIRINISKAAKN